MATKNLIPRASGEGGIGIEDVAWGDAHFNSGHFNKGLYVSGVSVMNGSINIANLPSSPTDLEVGDIYHDNGTLKIVTQ